MNKRKRVRDELKPQMNSRSQTETAVYRSYLLRCWAEFVDGQPVWRYSLEGVQDKCRLGFATLAALNAHLQQLEQE